jgi:hypothetical protein
MAAARIICAAHKSTPATFRHTDPCHNAIVIMRCRGQTYVTKRYSLPPIDSPILRSRMRTIPPESPIVDRQTVLIRMPDPISDANPPARNDQDALYDQGY